MGATDRRATSAPPAPVEEEVDSHSQVPEHEDLPVQATMHDLLSQAVDEVGSLKRTLEQLRD
eukprot:1623531-Amphidinium_carterae.1